jgi:SAM-dependent methyltransferase
MAELLDQFAAHARAWDRLGPPLRPSPEDVRRFAEGVADAAAARAGAGAKFQGVILGVTPELALMPWPARTHILAVDQSQPMLDAIWPAARVAHPARAVRRDWTDLPLDAGAADAVLGDGCYALLEPAHQRAVSREVRRVLAPHGRFVLRVFVRPERGETPDGVFAELEAGRIGSFHAFKWRLAMALQGEREDGVAVREVWEAWQARGLDRDALARRLGGRRDSIDSIDAYREAASRLWFPSLEGARRALGEQFRELACERPGYELGERCPIFRLALGD